MSELQPTLSNELFYLKWSNFQKNVSSEFKKIQEAADLVDITFSCDGGIQFGAHKLVLFACSPYFKEVLKVICAISNNFVKGNLCFGVPGTSLSDD